MATEVRNVPERDRYELLVDGEVTGVADYVEQGDRIIIRHTEIPAARRGHGLGAVLVRGALEDVRRQGRTVVPRCGYVARFIDSHGEFADLLDHTSP